MTPASLHRRAGASSVDGWTLALTPEDAGWRFCGLRIVDLEAGASRRFATDGDEVIVLPLWGSASVRVEGEREAIELHGRPSVFAGPTDVAYLPPGTDATIESEAGGRFALPSARAERRLPVRYGAARDVPIELRGGGDCSRQVNAFAMPWGMECDRLISCEVLVPAGNWSGYPPHKHDEVRDGESELEEIYYYELSRPSGIAYQRLYGTPDRPIELLAEVRSGDVVLIPHGWHGPTMTAPGYDLYFLNVMAGPGERAWLVSDDPDHAWVKEAWPAEGVDPRLPFGGGR